MAQDDKLRDRERADKIAVGRQQIGGCLAGKGDGAGGVAPGMVGNVLARRVEGFTSGLAVDPRYDSNARRGRIVVLNADSGCH